MRSQTTLWDTERIEVSQSMDMTAESLREYFARHKNVTLAWSGGKDSTALLTVVLYLIASKQVSKPETFTVMFADTRMELPPLSISAYSIIDQMRKLGIDVRVVLPPLDKRFFVYMLGRGVPPPNNNTLRWCTRQIKVDPMITEIEKLYKGEKLLTLTGVRLGESIIRDKRIALSCSKDGSECGQGYFQESLENHVSNTLAPIIHWRVCNVWDWLKVFAPQEKFGGWNTSMLADAYGGDEADEINARTGCIGCPLASKDVALDTTLLKFPWWDYIRPLTELKPLYRELRLPKYRLRKPGGESRKDGSLSKNQNRMGPLTFEARKYALNKIISIQTRVNESAKTQGKPTIDIINQEEIDRINYLIDQNTWPQRWTGEEPVATEPFIAHFQDGSIQQSLLKQI